MHGFKKIHKVQKVTMKSHSLLSLSLSLSKLLNLFISVSLCLIAEKLDVKSIVNVLINHCFHCHTKIFSPFKSSKSVLHS